MQSIRFEGRVAIVTGAGRGLGRAYAKALAERGARVVVNDWGGSMDGREPSRDAAQLVVDEIRAAGGEAVANFDTVAEEAGSRAIVQSALDAFGTVDILVNNAGTSGRGAFDEISLEAFKAVVGVHLFGTAGVIHAAWPILRSKGYGRIVVTASAAGLWGIENLSGYCAGKAGVIGLARGLAHEGEGSGIKVNVITPGAKTRMSADMFEGKGGWTWRPELVAPAVLYLTSEQCRHNGAIFAAMAGHFARVEPLQGPGMTFDPRVEVTPEEVLAAMNQIEGLEGARSMGHGLSGEIRSTAGEVKPRVS